MRSRGWADYIPSSGGRRQEVGGRKSDCGIGFADLKCRSLDSAALAAGEIGLARDDLRREEAACIFAS